MAQFPLEGSKLYGEARVVLPGAPVDVAALPKKPSDLPTTEADQGSEESHDLA